jgi:hypothetical protein
VQGDGYAFETASAGTQESDVKNRKIQLCRMQWILLITILKAAADLYFYLDPAAGSAPIGDVNPWHTILTGSWRNNTCG